MALKAKKVFFIVTRVLRVLFVLSLAYLLVLVGIVLWTFEVKLKRWPIFVYGAPFSLQVGDDIAEARLMERLARLGYMRGTSLLPKPGQWCQDGSTLRLFLKYSPLVSQGIATGPVDIGLDRNRVRSVRFMRSHENVNRIVLEPELLSVIAAPHRRPELCRPIPLDKIPSLLVDAIVLTEDTRFFSHRGIDLLSIGMALKTNLRAGRYVQGGSTIPQQLIRMTILTPEKTLGRKINEILLALVADAIYSKKTILQAYLNRVYFGQWGPFPIQGIGEAASHLFGKDASELTAAECSLMAATIRAPGVINPHRHPQRAKTRRNMVLGLLFKAGKISREQYEEAIDSPVKIRNPGAPSVRAASFMDLVKKSLPNQLPTPAGTRQDVLTSLDPLLQARADATLKRMGETGARSHLIIANPVTGDLKAFAAPGPGRWSGYGGNVESFLPLMIVPALIPDKEDRVKYTLTSQILFRSPVGRTITFRAAFRDERALLIQRLIASEGEKIPTLLKEFGIKAVFNREHILAVDAVSPMEMARIYSLMATLGNAAPLGPGIKVAGETSTDSSVERKRVSVKPAVLFLINYLLKGLDSAEVKAKGRSKAWDEPSFFTSRDKEGIWNIAYRSDVLLVLRIPGDHIGHLNMKETVDKLLPKTGPSTEGLPVVPDGIVFRKICVESGLRATSICPQVIREPFLKGTQPQEWCPLRHESNGVGSQLRKQPDFGLRQGHSLTKFRHHF
ncbi:MAG: transglycosylase domain-containing protein [Desulfomonilaceae bacterium]